MNVRKQLQYVICVVLLVWTLAGCGIPVVAPTIPAATASPVPAPTQPDPATPTVEFTGDLSAEAIATIRSLRQVDDYPLYTMRYHGTYDQPSASVEPAVRTSTWACSLFAALGDADHMLYGRNFDWEYSPAVLLFTDPPTGYASVSMVDIAYLGFGGVRAQGLTDLSLVELERLLDAPLLPFDGMNERGLVVGMAAVPPGQMERDPGKETIGSLRAIRRVLDRAGNVDEAVAVLQSYNIDMQGGTPIHYLVADPSGRAALVEFYRGEMVVTPNEGPWHLATNFLRAAAGDSPAGWCWRYDELDQQLAASQGQIAMPAAMNLLAAVAQRNTQWSVVYEMSTGDVHVVMGQDYQDRHTFRLDLMDR